MEQIKNEFFQVEVNLDGGTLHSILFKGKEAQYQVEPESWPCQDVIIFPLPGKNIFNYEGKTYENSVRHGLLREGKVEVFNKKEDEITLIFKSSEETLKVYPFNFEFYLTYKLHKNHIKVKSRVVNKGEKPMYCSFGSHLAYRVDPKKAFIEFKNDSLRFLPLDKEGIIQIDEEHGFKLIDKKLYVEKPLFAKYDTLVFKNTEGGLTLHTENEKIKVKYNFDAPIFAVWSKPNNGNFVCIEPWWGISNYSSSIQELTTYKFINKVEKEIEFNYSYEFED